MQNILVVCVGNICRSPIAEAMLAREFPEKKVWSAGLGALVGDPADPLSVEVAAANGLDLSKHRAQQVASWMCQNTDLILVMEQGHKAELEQRYPLVRGKVFRLGELQRLDIADPHKQPKAAFEAAFADIALGVAAWVPRIHQLG
ncbi:low molecular weight protein-tyrosine-phosphatase [Variovorax sp. dw_954]|uniref:low molecular weight protein-tyrosine-phosphatase n=1 Tax=Variovorax sp. dw_954 TaxID=2720078 RepID=UPI001BD54D12|nr:low molecular weight protein-tyrosine-phosphatase [Variovorax sp. dw_954]